MCMGHQPTTTAQALAAPHASNIIAKADRCLPILLDWANEVVAQNPDLTLGVALRQIHDRLTGRHGHDLAEQAWTLLAGEHAARHPQVARPEFRTSRPVILDKLEARSWVADQPVPADPFAELV